MKIMDCVELCTENLANPVQVVQVGAGKVAAGITAATLVEWARIVFVARVLDLDIPVAGE